MLGKVLVLSWTVPPETTGSAIIVGNLAKQFKREEMILAGERSWGRPPVAWLREWPEIVYLASSLPAGWRGDRWWRRIQVPFFLTRTIRLVQKHRCRSIVSVFPREEHLLIGYLASLATGARFYPYLHNTYLENRQGVALLFAQWLQKRAFRRASHVFVMSEGMMELYRHRYSGLKCSPLPHSFNEPLPTLALEHPPAAGVPIRLMLCGTINNFSLDATCRLRQAVRELPETELTLLTGTAHSQLSNWGMLGERVSVQTASRDEVVTRLRSADILLLPHGFTGPYSREEFATIFPTKTIEYLISGRPILAHVPPDSFIARFLRDADCALLVETPEVSALKTAIRRLSTENDLRERLVRNALKAAEPFQAAKVADEFRRRLNAN